MDQREYPVLSEYVDQSQTPTPTNVSEKAARGSRYPSLYLIIKHLLLAIIFLMVIWTMLEILYADQKDQSRYPPEMPESSVSMIKSIILLGRVMVVVICIFGVVGMVKESFSLSLVFSVFMFIRLCGTLYIPFFNNGFVSTGLICLVTFMSFIFLLLVRRTEQPFHSTSSPSNSIHIGIDNPIRVQPLL